MSGVELTTPDETISLRKGAAQSVFAWVRDNGGTCPEAVSQAVEQVSKSGGTPLVVAEKMRVLGVVQLKDVVKGGIRERFAQLRKMGIRTVMITGDNPMTAAAIAAEAGVDDFIAEAKPASRNRSARAATGRWRAAPPGRKAGTRGPSSCSERKG